MVELRRTGTRRDAHPVLVCGCGHSETVHNIDSVKKPCSVGACGCLTFRLHERHWRLHQWEIEPV